MELSRVRLTRTETAIPELAPEYVPPAAERAIAAEDRTGFGTVGSRWFPPGWPLKYLLVAFPLWWVLGLNTLIFPLSAVVMGRQLLRRRSIRVPTVFWMWALFLVWQIVGLALLNLSPPGTHPGSVSGRLISIVFSLVEYAGVTITLLYVANLPRDQVPQSVVGRWLGWFFLTVAAGGFLGLIAPTLSFRSAIEFVLPHSITVNGYVQALVHPVTAQLQDVLNTTITPRPSAPFGYTNFWGNAVSILVLYFVAAWVIPARGRRKFAYFLIVAVTVVPVVLSLNRGLWIGIGVTLLWLLGRMLVQRRVGRVVGALMAVLLAVAVFLLSPLTSVVSARLENGVSNDIRAFVDNLSIVAAENSPVVGYGGNRHANGSSASIAVGPSPDCPQCGDVPTGSTGQLWSVLFNNGWGGTLLYFGFFATSLWIYRRQRGALAEAGLITILLTFVYMLFYSALPLAPTLTMIAVGLLWREHDAAPPPLRPGQVTAPIRVVPAERTPRRLPVGSRTDS